MNKPNNYDNTQVGTFERVAPGPHSAIILNVKEETSKSGQAMVAVTLDFAPDDAQPKYFTHAYADDTRTDKKWPYQAVQYILIYDQNGNTSRSFKAFCTSFENSNGVTMKWGEAFEGQFRGKKIGVTYGVVEEEYNGEIKDRTRIRWFFDVHKIAEQTVPEKRFLKLSEPAKTASGAEDWMNIPNGTEQLPFR